MEQHPLIKAYKTFVMNRSYNQIGVIGQPDAGKSALINLLCESKAYISVETDATLNTKAYAYNDYGYIVDFPGVGTEIMSVKRYKKIIQSINIQHYLYVFSSKIKAVDIEMIRYLVKQGKTVTFIYNKADTLIDVSGIETIDVLMHSKNTELKVTMKPFMDMHQSYIFTSVLNHSGINTLKETINKIFDAEEQAFYKRFTDVEYKQNYLNYKVNSAFPKLFTPSFKTIIMKENYDSLERTLMSHFKIQEDDIIERKHKWLKIESYVKSFENEKSNQRMNKTIEFTKIVQLLRTSFKMKSVNPIISVITSVFEIGIVNALPKFQAINKYMDEIRKIADDIIAEEQNKYKQHL
ncbi:GTPase domain-containing protein [Macrococcus armenti]|uniref:GTPase domain-containing protein n=1 Tax=Macrococcus armenti TaxID=2875764 RepID=UPI001CCB0D5F|nr:GTPase domain-containing protein [Macrococcus armenti]UBH13294.1 50S ribosome-binding GTPase [Macrococcus armenti]